MKRDVAILMLFNKEGKVLLQHRAEHLERWPGYWGFFGGGIDEGETPEEGFKREIMEELGYRVEKPELLLQEEYGGQHGYYGMKYVYTCEHDETQEFKLCYESQGYGWFGLEEIEKLKDNRLHSEDYQSIMRIIEERTVE